MFPPLLGSLLPSPRPAPRPVRLNQLNRTAWMFWPEPLSILFSSRGVSQAVEASHSTAPSLSLQYVNLIDLEPASSFLPHPGAAGGRYFPRAIDPQGATR